MKMITKLMDEELASSLFDEIFRKIKDDFDEFLARTKDRVKEEDQMFQKFISELQQRKIDVTGAIIAYEFLSRAEKELNDVSYTATSFGTQVTVDVVS